MGGKQKADGAGDSVADKYRLAGDLADIEGNVLLGDGEEISRGTVIGITVPSEFPVRLNIEGTFIGKDLEIVANDPPYRKLLDDTEAAHIAGEALHEFTLAEPLIEELKVLKRRYIHIYHHNLATTILIARMLAGGRLDLESITKVCSGMMTHDLGMSRLDPHLVTNTDFLDEDEMRQIRTHTIVGAVLLRHYVGAGLESAFCLRHHELGGNGYPLPAEESSGLVEMIAVADIFNALISHRSFRLFAYDTRGALDYLTKAADRDDIDERAVKLLVAAYRTGSPAADSIVLSRAGLGYHPEENFYGVDLSLEN